MVAGDLGMGSRGYEVDWKSSFRDVSGVIILDRAT